ncbi:ATP-binding protein [Streptomyces albidoflavus]|uniref:ATP-binding protein n=1 Tax=Streptomyces albidoflavus TaxID=1886 RepID=UPI00101E5061|nr:ATP-binding protein [Streptomyces albidoflavus]MBV7651625.1 ATP-binding protein [Streptomyces albidoflavus]MBV7713092.1 ATP-binding protein [Streptomyces albidoflavus]RZE07092.1 ATP-binding protein [Streptomyces albidoflavus]RZE08464.1 ATP-binding protein [Streptomyces albidoflavus]
MPRLTMRVRPTGPPGYSETLPREPESAAPARRLVRMSCCVWGLEALAAAGAVIITELVANSVRHARRESIRVTVERPAEHRVRLGVVDFSKEPPVYRAAGPGDETGRGLVLVDALAAEWGTELLPWGKRVWAELCGEGEG